MWKAYYPTTAEELQRNVNSGFNFSNIKFISEP